jgi:cell division protein FtsZ
LINITGGSNLTLWEVNEAASVIQHAAGDRVNVIFGMVIDEALREEIRVTVIATGFNKESKIKSVLVSPKENMKHFEPINLNELDKPTFIRKQKEEEKIHPKMPLVPKPARTNIYSFEEEELPPEPDELDTPTFLRKQMD